jgi:hypothetical protein
VLRLPGAADEEGLLARQLGSCTLSVLDASQNQLVRERG